MKEENGMMKLQRLVISCGGTGGHFYPGLSIARRFQERGGEVLLLLSGIHARNQCETASRYGVAAVALPQMPHYRRHPLLFLRGLIGGYFAARREIRNFSPQAMLGMGSFAALPVVRAAVSCRIPLFLHDGNARIGKGNRFFSRWAEFAGSAFPAVNSEKCRCPVFECGMPLRPELSAGLIADKAGALDAVNKEFGTGFQAAQPVFLVTGGSQGAAVFNRILPQAFLRCHGKFQVIHLAGKGKADEAAAIYQNAEFPYLLLESTEKMAQMMMAADVVFSRSGGSTLAELSFFGKPAVLIPYPYAAEGHQMDNARYFAGQEAAVVVENSAFDVEKALELLDDALNDREKWQIMGKNMQRLSRSDASDVMIDKISEQLN